MSVFDRKFIQLTTPLFFFLLLLLFSFYSILPEKKRTHCLEIVFLPDLKTFNSEVYAIDSLLDISKVRVFQTIHLPERVSSYQQALMQLRSKIRTLYKDKDTLNGVRLNLDNKTPWQAYIQVIDICREEKIKVYCPLGNDIWIFYPRSKSEVFVDKKIKDWHVSSQPLGYL
ncbi:MAG TPA: hypothetical protein VNZ86_06970 [Bacteroidia bacterium]|nr:hypothetical protein [Bacteroidia bacterium]